VGNIHRGGVIASIVGTLSVIEPDDARRLKGFLVNNFRGDPELFSEGRRFLERRAGIPCLGVVPHFPGASRLPAEDAMALDDAGEAGSGGLRIAVPRLSRMANFDDLDPLRLEPEISLRIVQPGEPLPGDADLVILPGSKSTIADLAFFRDQGWDIDLKAHARRGGAVLGICGGYQMLGRRIHDPEGLEGPAGSVDGLGLLDVETVLLPDKTTRRTLASHCLTGTPLKAYEIHLGRTEGPDCARPFATIRDRPEGARSADGRIQGTYLHGAFESDAFRRAFLASMGVRAFGPSHATRVEETIDALARHLESHVNLRRILDLATEPKLP
ncbi:MAG TPA: cobyric acid synthase, partial [Bryobacterales bacterium]|nr:cobyric acid synthase [Bryobacterales bacterium]